jgi:pre-mRNA-splicing factor SYF1
MECYDLFGRISLCSPLQKIMDYSSNFPLTFPIPSPATHPDLISTADLNREEDLLRNPTSFRAWWTAINVMRENYAVQSKVELASAKLDPTTSAILGPLALPLARHTLQRLTYTYEAALAQFPNSFKMWKSYLQMRMSFVLGKHVVKRRAGGKKKFPEMKEALEDAEEDLEEWETSLDPVVGWEEWKALVAVFERALMWIPKVLKIIQLLIFFFSSLMSYKLVAAKIMAHVFLCFLSSTVSCSPFAYTL